MSDNEKGFASRWSKKKAEAREETVTTVSLEEQSDLTLEEQSDLILEEQNSLQETEPSNDDMLTEEDFDDVDFDALDKSSDYTRFVKSNVPAAIQKKALRKLWDSDSVFEVLDGMNDYDEDFTGDGLAGKVLKTAYQVGRGFVTDEDEAEKVTKSDDAEAPDEQVAETREIDVDDDQEKLTEAPASEKTTVDL